MTPVIGAWVHAPIQRSITNVQIVRWSIYDTRRPEHPHLQVLWYKHPPQGTSARTCYMESCMEMASSHLHLWLCIQSYTASQFLHTSNDPLLSQGPAHCHIKYLTLATSSSSVVPQWPLFSVLFEPPYPDYFWLPCLTWFNPLSLSLFRSLFPNW